MCIVSYRTVLHSLRVFRPSCRGRHGDVVPCRVVQSSAREQTERPGQFSKPCVYPGSYLAKSVPPRPGSAALRQTCVPALGRTHRLQGRERCGDGLWASSPRVGSTGRAERRGVHQPLLWMDLEPCPIAASVIIPAWIAIRAHLSVATGGVIQLVGMISFR